VPRFGFRQPVQLIVSVFAGARSVSHLDAVAVFVVFVFDRRRTATRVNDFGQPISRIIGVRRRAFRWVGQLREVSSKVVFLGRFTAQRINDFNDLLQNVAFVFGRVFIAVDLLDDLASTVVFRFRDRFVGCFYLDRRVIRVIRVFRLVAISISDAFDVAIPVISVFRDACLRRNFSEEVSCRRRAFRRPGRVRRLDDDPQREPNVAAGKNVRRAGRARDGRTTTARAVTPFPLVGVCGRRNRRPVSGASSKRLADYKLTGDTHWPRIYRSTCWYPLLGAVVAAVDHVYLTSGVDRYALGGYKLPRPRAF